MVLGDTFGALSICYLYYLGLPKMPTVSRYLFSLVTGSSLNSSEMPKYQAKKRKIIEAEQFLPPHQIPRGVGVLREENSSESVFVIETMQGEVVRVKSGEWIVAEGEAHPDRYYPIANEIFRDLYEPLNETASH